MKTKLDDPINVIQNNEGWPSDYSIVVKDGSCYGLTKREYFVAMAMQGILASYTNRMDWLDADLVARKSVLYAESVINLLNKES